MMYFFNVNVSILSIVYVTFNFYIIIVDVTFSVNEILQRKLKLNAQNIKNATKN